MKGDLRRVYVISRSKKNCAVVAECDECEDGRVVWRGLPIGEAALLRDATASKPEVVCEECEKKVRE